MVTDPIFAAAADILEVRSSTSFGEFPDGCSAEELNSWPSGDDTNSLGVLAMHALGATRSSG